MSQLLFERSAPEAPGNITLVSQNKVPILHIGNNLLLFCFWVASSLLFQTPISPYFCTRIKTRSVACALMRIVHFFNGILVPANRQKMECVLHLGATHTRVNMAGSSRTGRKLSTIVSFCDNVPFRIQEVRTTVTRSF